mmetsp:Transcript_80244/g.155089  ORF Transcript_80244/g.155089 Transcript_80244/m.155089 type:complete len:827 (+) Transcript_80244:35-2515(+)
MWPATYDAGAPATAGAEYEGHYEAGEEENWYDEEGWEDGGHYAGFETGMGSFDAYGGYGGGDWAHGGAFENNGNRTAAGFHTVEVNLYSMVFTLDEDLEPKDHYAGLEYDERSMLLVLGAEDIEEGPRKDWHSRMHPEPPLHTEKREAARVAAGGPGNKAGAVPGSVFEGLQQQQQQQQEQHEEGNAASASATMAATPPRRQKANDPETPTPQDQQQFAKASAQTPGSPLLGVANNGSMMGSPLLSESQSPNSANAENSKLVLGKSKVELLQKMIHELKQRRKQAGSAEEPAAAASITSSPPAADGTPASAAPRSSRRPARRSAASSSTAPGMMCPAGHSLKLFPTPENGWWCSVCRTEHFQGSTFYSCRICDFDKCEHCALPFERPSSGESSCSAWDEASSPGCGQSPSVSPSPEPLELGPPPRGGQRRSSRQRKVQRRIHCAEEQSQHGDRRQDEPRGTSSSQAVRQGRVASSQLVMSPSMNGRAQRHPQGGRARKKRRVQLVAAGSADEAELQRDSDCCAEDLPSDDGLAESSMGTSDDGGPPVEASSRQPAARLRRTRRRGGAGLVPRARRAGEAVPERWDPASEEAMRQGQGGDLPTTRGNAQLRRASGRKGRSRCSSRAEAGAGRNQKGSEVAQSARTRRAHMPNIDEASVGSGDPPPNKKGRVANALSLPAAESPSLRGFPSGVRAVSLARPPGPMAVPDSRRSPDLSLRGSVGTSMSAFEDARIPRRAAETSSDDFLRRVLRASSQQVKKGGGNVLTGNVMSQEMLGDGGEGSHVQKVNGSNVALKQSLGRAKMTGPPSMRKALVDLASQMDCKSRRV